MLNIEPESALLFILYDIKSMKNSNGFPKPSKLQLGYPKKITLHPLFGHSDVKFTQK